MEIPDVIVINKADHPATRTMRSEIRSILSLGGGREWKPPIVETEAINGEGVGELWDAVASTASTWEQDGLAERRRRSVEHEVVAVAVSQARRRLLEAIERDDELERLLDDVQRAAGRPADGATQMLAERVLRDASRRRRRLRLRHAAARSRSAAAPRRRPRPPRRGRASRRPPCRRRARGPCRRRRSGRSRPAACRGCREMSCMWLHFGSLKGTHSTLSSSPFSSRHLEHPDRLDRDHAARERRLGDQHQGVDRVAVAAERVDDEAVVRRVDDARPERAVEHDVAELGSYSYLLRLPLGISTKT